MKKIISALSLSLILISCGAQSNNSLFGKEKINKTIKKEEAIKIAGVNYEEKSRIKDIPFNLTSYDFKNNSKDKNFDLDELVKNNIPLTLIKGSKSEYKIIDGETKEILNGEYGKNIPCGVFEIEEGKFVSRRYYGENEIEMHFFRKTTSDFFREFRFVKDFMGSSFAFIVELYYKVDIVNKEQLNGIFTRIKIIELEPTNGYKIIGGLKDKKDIFKFKEEIYSELNIKDDFDNTLIDLNLLDISKDNNYYYNMEKGLVYSYKEKDKSEEFVLLKDYEFNYFDK